MYRKTIRENLFDSDPGWLGPKFMAGFSKETDLEQRRAIIGRARHKGSMPPYVLRKLRRAMDQQRVIWQQADIDAVADTSDGIELRLSDGTHVEADQILLATGFETNRPGGDMLDTLIDAASLPCAACGYPVIDRALRWHPRIHVSGPLAELELGPVSRNIAGARYAGDRIIRALRMA
ncbi:MAG: hypothetical protein AAFV29_18450 [Myxococcota bacterium]